MKSQFNNEVVMIMGSSGSWGTELITQLLKTNVKEIRGVARNEYRQVSSERFFNDKRLKIIIGDVRDYETVDKVCKDVDIVFLLSAIKHVPLAEKFPYETIKTNIIGTKNIIKASIANKVKKVIDVSSDKACLPINLYGLTKAIGEKLILHASTLGSKTKFMVVRGGNVIGTNGSVIPFWIDQIKRFNKITITDKEMTRYFLTLPEAIKLLFVAVKSDIDGGLFVMRMPSCRLIDLAKVLIGYYGDKNTKIEITGIRPGEKIDEVLVSKHETPNAYEYGKQYYIITTNPNAKLKFQKTLNKIMEEYNSYQKLMSKEEIRELLRKAGYLK